MDSIIASSAIVLKYNQYNNLNSWEIITHHRKIIETTNSLKNIAWISLIYWEWCFYDSTILHSILLKEFCFTSIIERVALIIPSWCISIVKSIWKWSEYILPQLSKGISKYLWILKLQWDKYFKKLEQSYSCKILLIST